MIGLHHVSEARLSRYLCAFDFRYNLRADLGVMDAQRADESTRSGVGERLTDDQRGEAA